MSRIRILASLLWAVIVTTLLWLMSCFVTLLPVLMFTIPIALLAGLWKRSLLEWVATLILLLGPIVLVELLTTPAIRFGLRIAPLPAGRATARRVPATLVVGWALALGALVLNDAEWQPLFAMCLAGLVVAWRLRSLSRAWTGTPRGRFVLFLRRFGKAGDRLVGSAIRGAVPERAALVFLADRRNTGESWDPFLVGYDGLWSTRAIPLYLEADDAEWVDRVRALVGAADAVVLDATDWSTAMEMEAQILWESNAADKTIVLSKNEGHDLETIPARQVIVYHSSWRAAHDRIFWGFVATILMPLALYQSAAGSQEYPDPILAIPLVALWIWLFVRPLMDKPSAGALKTSLQAILG